MKNRFLLFSSSVRKIMVPALVIVLLNVFFPAASQAQSWSILGSGDQISSVASSYTSICVADNVPYVVYVEGSSSGGVGKVKRRNAAGIWEQVGGNLSVSTISHTGIFHDSNNKLYVTYIDESSGKLCMQYYDAAAAAWAPLILGNVNVSGGSATYTSGVSNTRSVVAFDADDVPYIAYSERDHIGTAV